MRESASWYIGCSRITELPSGQRDENVVERGVMRRERRQLELPLLQQGEQRRQRAVELFHGQRDSTAGGRRPHRGDPAQAAHGVAHVRDAVGERELDYVLRAQRRDQLARRAERNDLAMI